MISCDPKLIGFDVISACDRWAAANAVRITTSNDRVSQCISGSTAIVAARRC